MKAPRTIDSFDADERAVIYLRHTGWEQASAATLAAVFNTNERVIRKIIRGQRALGLKAVVDGQEGSR